MSFSVYDASAPVFVNALTQIPNWLDKALAEGKAESSLMEAKLAPDMFALPRQIQVASDTAKAAVARLAGIEAPSMPDTEASFAELKDPVKDKLRRFELYPRFGDGRFFPTLDSAVDAYRAQHRPEGTP